MHAPHYRSKSMGGGGAVSRIDIGFGKGASSASRLQQSRAQGIRADPAVDLSATLPTPTTTTGLNPSTGGIGRMAVPRSKSSHVHRVLQQKRHGRSPATAHGKSISLAGRPEVSDSDPHEDETSMVGGRAFRSGPSQDEEGWQLSPPRHQQQRPTAPRAAAAARHSTQQIMFEAPVNDRRFKFLRKGETVVSKIIAGQYETPSYNPQDVRMRVVPRTTGEPTTAAVVNRKDAFEPRWSNASLEGSRRHVSPSTYENYSSGDDSLDGGRPLTHGRVPEDFPERARTSPSLRSHDDRQHHGTRSSPERRSFTKLKISVGPDTSLQGALNVRSVAKPKLKRRPSSATMPHTGKALPSRHSPKFRLRRTRPQKGSLFPDIRQNTTRRSYGVQRSRQMTFDVPWDPNLSAAQTRRLIGATENPATKQPEPRPPSASHAIINLHFGGDSDSSDRGLSDEGDASSVFLTSEVDNQTSRQRAIEERRAERRARAQAKKAAEKAAKLKLAEQKRLAMLESKEKAERLAAEQRAKKAAADAARVEAEVIAKQMADEAEALKRAKAAAAVKVRKYTSEELAQRAANKKAIDRKREQIQMTREDHQAWDLREFETMREKHFGPHNDQIRQIGGWKTVPIFISSTFRDMHGERDVLTREVFPALNERCKRLHINVVPVDLRWGLTAEQCEVEGACQLCLKEIDVGRPFFLGLLGTRYGWIPPTYGITTEEKSFDWIRDLPVTRSITELEILHGFLWPHKRPDGSDGPQPAHAFMYFRDPSFLQDVPEHLLPIFLDPDEENRSKSRDLEERIRQYPYRTLFENYPCEYDKESTDEKPMVKGLDTFRDHVLEDLWSVLKAEYSVPYAQTQWDYRFSERFLHNLFMIEKAQQFEEMCPIPEIMHELTDALHSATESGTPLLVTGEPGTGMTTALAAFTVRYKEQLHKIHGQEEALIFTHFVGNSANFSTDLRRLLHRMCSELDDYFELDIEIPETISRLKRCLAKCIVKVDELAKQRNEIVYILLDHVERLKSGGGDSAGSGVHSLPRKQKKRQGSATSRSSKGRNRRSFAAPNADEQNMFEWLPTLLIDINSSTKKTNIHFILSAASSSALIELSSREYPMFALMPLRMEQSTKLIESSLKLYRKTLTQDQMQGVLAKHKSDNPLYLRLFCEELRLHGLYGMAGEGVDMKIKQLPGDTLDLVQASLQRIEDAVGKQLVTDCLGLICASHHGLIEEELLEMLGSDWDGSDTLPRAIWAQLQQNISFIVSKFRGVQSVYKIVHSQFLDGVKRRYLNDMEQRERIYEKLVDFYRSKGDPLGDHSWTGDNQRAYQDIVFYQLRMGSRSLTELHSTLCNLYFIEKRCALDASAVYDLAAEYEVVLDLLRDNTAVVTKAIRRQRFLDIKQRTLEAAMNQKKATAKEKDPSNENKESVAAGTQSEPVSIPAVSPGSNPKKARTPAQLLAQAARAFSSQGRLRRLKRSLEELGGSQLSEAQRITSTHRGTQQKARDFFGNKHILEMPQFPTDTKDSEGIKLFVEQLLVRLKEFLHMIRSQSHVLAVSPSLTFQLALTQPRNSGPDLAAQARVEACMTPSSWVEWVNRPAQDLKLVDRSANSRCNCVAVSADMAAVGFEDSSIQIISIENLKVRQELNSHDDGITAIAWARFLLASGDRTGRILVWNSANFALLYSLDGHQGVINDLDFSDEGRHLVSVCNDATMRIWSTHGEDFDEIQTVWDKAHVSSLTAVAYHNKSWSGQQGRQSREEVKYIACGASSGKVMVWDASAITLGVEIMFRLHRHTREVQALDFNSEGTLLCSGSLDHLVAIWSMHSGELVRILREHVRGITSVKFDETGERLFSAGMDNVLNMWQVTESFQDPESEEDITSTRTLRGHSDTVSGFVLLPEKQQLLSVSHDRTMKLWNVESGAELDAESDPSNAPSPRDGRLSRSNSQESPNATSLAKRARERANSLTKYNPGLEYHSDRCCVCALSHDGCMAASGSYDATVKLWSISPDMQLLATNREHVDTISALAFSPDGQILFSGSDDQSIILSQIVLSSQQMEGDDGYTVTTADMYTVRQKHKSDLHANRVVDIHTPNNTTVLSADADCAVIIWSYHHGNADELAAQRDDSFEGSYRVNNKFFELTPLIRLDCGYLTGEIGTGVHLSFDIDQHLVFMITDKGQLQAWSLQGSIRIFKDDTPPQIDEKLIAEMELAAEKSKKDKKERQEESRKSLEANPFASSQKSPKFGLATLSKLKRRARSLTSHVHRYKGLLTPSPPTLCIDILNPSTERRPLSSTLRFPTLNINAIGVEEDGERTVFDPTASAQVAQDAVTACDTASNHTLMLVGFDSGRLVMYRIAFGLASSPKARKIASVLMKSGFQTESDSEDENDGSPDAVQQSTAGFEDQPTVDLHFYVVEYVSKGAFQGHEGAITSVRFNPDGTHCVSTSEDRHLMVWCSDTGMRVGEFVLGGECYSGALGLDRSTLLCGDATGQLCHLCVKWKAPGSILLEKVLTVEYVNEQRKKEAAERIQHEKEEAQRVLMGLGGALTPKQSRRQLLGHLSPKQSRRQLLQRHLSPPDGLVAPPASGLPPHMLHKAKRTGARISRHDTDAQSALSIGVVQLCDWYTSHVAAQLHEMWREARPKQPDGSYEPRIKIVGGHVYDIANLSFADLPEHYQYENMQAATVACNDVFEQVINGKPFDDDFILRASISQHEAWIERNSEWAPAEQLVPFEQLSQEDKDKDTVIVRKAMKAFEPYVDGLLQETLARENEWARQRAASALRRS